MDRLSRDDKSAYFAEIQQPGYTVSRWDIFTKQVRVLTEDNVYAYETVSPDERWLVRTRQRSLEVRLISGGPWTRLATTSANETLLDVTPDGNWVYYRDRDNAGKPALYRVATRGGAPERMGDFPEGEAGTMRVSPDGSKVVVEVYNSSNGFETWSLENFVPLEPKR
jgi:Tol biopolymer transport system component